ncbi:hypothetical protein C7999DRAFT_31717 [Corynascus novoguineensis]|uniref:Uncharacterized protein n=1 Tax=Corynascus novoguineensis TaxID=1126955 RepID=A0AAN7CT98_9PEZI|nr:hypothetical protein C7999DRAFT_31717 [Corynascus novoguineensis]
MLLNMDVQMAEDSDTPTVIRACTADYNTSGTMKVAFVPDVTKASLCTTANNSGNGGEFLVGHLLPAGRQVKSYLVSQKPSCTNNAIAFGYSQSSVIGIFAGAEVHQHGVTLDVLDKFLKYAEDQSISKTTVVQLCFLFFIPFIGPTGGGAIAAGVRILIQLVGAAGEVGMAVYGVVSDPENAFMTVFSTLMRAGFGRGSFRSAANSRRDMSSMEYNSLWNPKSKLDTEQMA